MARVLITGASGLLGSNLALDWSRCHAVSAVYHSQPVQLPGATVIQADLTRAAEVGRLMQEQRPDWVVHCAAATQVDRCQRDPEWADSLNREMAELVAVAAHQLGARLLHISTDAVFDGERGQYSEQDLPRPINTYGASKLAGERAVAAADPRALIVRTNFFGWNLVPKQSLAEWFLSNLEAGRSCPGFTDVLFSPLLAGHLGVLLQALLERGASGLYHLCGGTCLSKFEFGRQLALALGFPADLVLPSSVDEANLAAPRPRRICLDGTKVARELGRPLPPLQQGLSDLRQQLETRRGVLTPRMNQEGSHD